jgi:CubicO group peptidase (beta-lactamase class C family)
MLAACSRVYHAASNPGDNRDDAPPRGSQKPGEYFLYSKWGFNTLGTIFEQVTRQSIFDALQRDLAEPIRMQYLRRELHSRTSNTSSSIHLACHMFFSTRDMARLGYLMLRGGNWNGRQIVPADWLRESTRAITLVHEMIAPGNLNVEPGEFLVVLELIVGARIKKEPPRELS